MTRNNDLNIRLAFHADSETLAALIGELGYPNTNAFAPEKLKQLAKGEDDRAFVAEDEGKVVGFAGCHIIPLIHEEHNLCRVSDKDRLALSR